jgi:hypothetical protein
MRSHEYANARATDYPDDPANAMHRRSHAADKLLLDIEVERLVSLSPGFGGSDEFSVLHSAARRRQPAGAVGLQALGGASFSCASEKRAPIGRNVRALWPLRRPGRHF